MFPAMLGISFCAIFFLEAPVYVQKNKCIGSLVFGKNRKFLSAWLNSKSTTIFEPIYLCSIFEPIYSTNFHDVKSWTSQREFCGADIPPKTVYSKSIFLIKFTNTEFRSKREISGKKYPTRESVYAPSPIFPTWGINARQTRYLPLFFLFILTKPNFANFWIG